MDNTMAFLRVLVERDGSMWMAQGLEIDYASAGTTAGDARERFESGLVETAKAQLRANGGVDALLKVAPQKVWQRWWKPGPGRTWATGHRDMSAIEGTCDEVLKVLPFTCIAYLTEAPAAVA